ncbi:MAG TPA: STAS domain-containing protein [Burkholderiales bacterium]|nr:STAS domain-containing protein [Burkholderiales bacterium]
MPVPHRNYADVRVVTPAGRLDHANCDTFRADIAEHVDACVVGGRLVLDLSGLEYVSSAGLRCLMLAAKEADLRGIRMVVAAMQPVVAEIFQISRFHLVFDIFATLGEALAAISPDAARAYQHG